MYIIQFPLLLGGGKKSKVTKEGKGNEREGKKKGKEKGKEKGRKREEGKKGRRRNQENQSHVPVDFYCLIK